MSRLRSNCAVATVLLALAPLAGCSSSSTSYPLPAAPAGATTLLVRLGDDTLGFEQYTRSATRMQGVLVQRVPFTTVANYDLTCPGCGGAPTEFAGGDELELAALEMEDYERSAAEAQSS